MPALLTAQSIAMVAIFAAGFACGYAVRNYVSCWRRERARTVFEYEQ